MPLKKATVLIVSGSSGIGLRSGPKPYSKEVAGHMLVYAQPCFNQLIKGNN